MDGAHRQKKMDQNIIGKYGMEKIKLKIGMVKFVFSV